MLGSLSDKVVYTRLLRLREACKLSESFGLLVPENVNNEWGKYVQFSKVRCVCACVRACVCINACVVSVPECIHVLLQYQSPINSFSVVISGTVK